MDHGRAELRWIGGRERSLERGQDGLGVGSGHGERVGSALEEDGDVGGGSGLHCAFFHSKVEDRRERGRCG